MKIDFLLCLKPQAPQVSYPMEAIGPIASSRDGVYLVGGAPSGNAYVWEVKKKKKKKSRFLILVRHDAFGNSLSLGVL